MILFYIWQVEEMQKETGLSIDGWPFNTQLVSNKQLLPHVHLAVCTSMVPYWGRRVFILATRKWLINPHSFGKIFQDPPVNSLVCNGPMNPVNVLEIRCGVSD